MSTPYRDAPQEAQQPRRPIILFVVAALFVIGMVALIRSCTSAARETATAFLERVGARDYDGAYDLTSAALRAEVPREGLEAYLRAGVPGLVSVDEASVDQVFGSPDRFCCSASLSGDLVRSRSDLDRDQFFLVLVEEEGRWRVTSASRERPPACRDDGSD